MAELILARHGETQWNVSEVFRGRADIELNTAGVKQARLLADYLSKVEMEAVYSSPLKRAWQTAETVARPHQLKVEAAPGLIDFDFGQWQGVSLKEVKEKYLELYTEWAKHPEQVKVPGGESLDDVSKRAVELVVRLIHQHKGTLALVSHRVVHKVLICALLGLDNSHFWNIRLDTCGITTFEFDSGRFVLTRHNDTSFLAGVKRAAASDF